MNLKILSCGARRGRFLLPSIILFTLLFVFMSPFLGVTQDDGKMILGKVYNDTDIVPPMYGPLPINIVIDDYFMGRVEPGESLVIELKSRRVPYVVKAYVFDYDGSSFFAVVDLPLSNPVMVPVSHRGEISPFWVSFEGIR